ncbi:phenylalanyl-tRNA ligase subunit beta [Salinisphaera dokdonensis CL-ES53]|uniref:Phenylalanine--tRNA ligase beta subunit n=1 Tax=Salinisphaera dokdonensis CL-ES53 TaxID=1304272 RepID=A0ABV2AWD3_9GAMM
MKISEQWLREWVVTDAPLDSIADTLTMAGLEVDEIVDGGPELDGVVVGRITRCAPHPKADRLQLCTVDIGADEPLAIVCGAPNAVEGLRVPVARVGATLPNGLTIEATEIRNEPSAGMLCSASELGLSADAGGLWELGPDAPVGTTLGSYLDLPDHVLDIDLTPNRGDCLSVRGIARELAVAFDTAMSVPEMAAAQPQTDHVRSVHIDAPTHCAGYAARCVAGVQPDACTPVWMAERLRRAGVRRINLPVDIGNYVMLEFGQPMHAFDGDRLVGDIRVRLARADERIVTLDGEEVTLAAQTLVIADDEGPVAIAGMIGGQRTAVDETTRNVVFESACFTPSAVAGQGRRYKIHTDSLHRFERGVDPELHPSALERATSLLLEHGGGACGPVNHVLGTPIWPGSRNISLAAGNVERLLGQRIDADWIEHALTSLGVGVERRGDSEWSAQPPSWRYDLEIEADLIEEVARVYGYDKLQTSSQNVSLPPVDSEVGRSVGEGADAVLRQRGYSEAITYSFVEPGLHAELTGSEPAVVLDNPISDQLVEMRRTLWASLLPSWAHNIRRQQASVRLYERGLQFAPEPSAENGIDQRDTIAGLISGSADDAHWDRPRRAVDFFDIKGDVEALFARVPSRPAFEAAEHPALHPGRSARIVLNGAPVGWVGQLSPKFGKRYKNNDLPYLFEVDSSALAISSAVRFEELSEQPVMRRDLAVVVEESTPVSSLLAAIESVDESALRSTEVFDLFRGPGLETGFKSVALGLIFQDKASTLTDEGVDRIITRVVTALGEQCDARIRGE